MSRRGFLVANSKTPSFRNVGNDDWKDKDDRSDKCPILKAAKDQKINIGDSTSLHASVTKIETRGNPLCNYLWKQKYPSALVASVNIHNPNELITDVGPFYLAGVYTFQITLNCNGQCIVHDTITIVVSDKIMCPILNAGINQTINIGEKTIVKATLSNIKNHFGTQCSYIWKQLNPKVPYINIETPYELSTSVGPFPIAGVYTFAITAKCNQYNCYNIETDTDCEECEISDIVTINVLASKLCPTLTIDSDFTIPFCKSARSVEFPLTGNILTDAINTGNIKYLWSSLNPNVSFSNKNGIISTEGKIKTLVNITNPVNLLVLEIILTIIEEHCSKSVTSNVTLLEENNNMIIIATPITTNSWNLSIQKMPDFGIKSIQWIELSNSAKISDSEKSSTTITFLSQGTFKILCNVKSNLGCSYTLYTPLTVTNIPILK